MKQIISIVALLLMIFAVVGCTTYQNIPPHPTGWRSPSLSAPAQNGAIVNLQKATSGPWAVVFFYPKADTPG